MIKYIIEILKIQSSVIIPGFGSLMITNSKRGTVAFNPHLKFNDGSMVKFIAEKEDLNEQKAQNKIAKFVREIEAELGKGNSYDMFEFGSFFKDKEGSVAFKMALTEDSKKSRTKKIEESKPAVAKKEAPKADGAAPKQTVVGKKVTDTKMAATKTPAKTTAIKKEVERPAAKEVSKKDASEKEEADRNTFVPSADRNKEAVETKKEESGKTDSKKIVLEGGIGDTKKAKALSKAETKRDTTRDKNKFTSAQEKALVEKAVAKKTNGSAVRKEKKKRRWPLIIILIVLIFGGGAAVFLFQDELAAIINCPEKEELVAETHDDDGNNEDIEDQEIVPDSTDEDYDAIHGYEANTEDMEEENTKEENMEEIAEEVIEEQIVNTSTGGNYHVIGNAFKDKSNAEGFVGDMKNKGYGSAKILGRFDGLHMVSVQQFDNNSSAASACSGVGGGAWVFKWPK